MNKEEIIERIWKGNILGKCLVCSKVVVLSEKEICHDCYLNETFKIKGVKNGERIN